ncbi:MAG: hypothetical protein ACJATT_000662 [Myxococcota bacterium]|jgi:hypothetical protein
MSRDDFGVPTPVARASARMFPQYREDLRVVFQLLHDVRLDPSNGDVFYLADLVTAVALNDHRTLYGSHHINGQLLRVGDGRWGTFTQHTQTPW